jgi:pantetheine-phosphate adenylyltransferase
MITINPVEGGVISDIDDKTAIYAGSFDPVTFGHLDLIQRAARIFPRLIVAVARNLEKKPLFSCSRRVKFLRESVKDSSRVEVNSFSGLLIDYAARRGARVLIRGLRAVSDFEYEFQMALTNRKLSPDLETVYLMPSEAYSYISSRMIKEIAFLGGDVSCFVPPPVAAALAAHRHED